MAEALGVAASGIAVAQIAIQVGGTVVKLKQLWDEVKDVPDDIAYLMDQIDCLNPVLLEAENNFGQNGLPSTVQHSPAFKSAATYCRKALQNLNDMVDELDAQINNAKGLHNKAKRLHKKLTAVKVVLRKDSLNKLERRLETAVRMLTLAQQSYLIALTQAQPEIIVQKFTALTIHEYQTKPQKILDSTSEDETRTAPKAARGQAPADCTFPKFHRKRRMPWANPSSSGRVIVDFFSSGYRVLVQAPAWLSYRSWELYSTKATGAWQWDLKVYRIVPLKSEVMEVACWGTPDELRKLFDTGQASPYDRADDGSTLLHMANRNFEVSKYLIAIGLDPSERNNRGGTPAFLWLFDATYLQKVLEIPSLAESCLSPPGEGYDEDDTNLQNSPKCSCRHGLRYSDLWELLLPYECPQHQYTSLESRLEALFHTPMLHSLTGLPRFLEPYWSTVPQAVCSNEIWPLLFLMIEPQIFEKLHAWSGALPPREAEIAEYIVRHTRNIHVTKIRKYDGYPGTGFMRMVALRSYKHWRFAKFTRYSMGSFLKHWLGLLKQAGIDLNTYGHREHEILVQTDATRSINIPDTQWRTIRLIGFKFGPEIGDWELYFEEPSDIFAGEFWKLIEDPPLNIPGSWVEETDDDRDY